MVAGIAIFDLAVSLLLYLGGGMRGLRVVAFSAFAIGCFQLFRFRGFLSLGMPLPRRGGRWFAAVILLAVVTNLLIALAPSTKIDELYYHMLVPKRVVEDGGLHLYRMPFESAMPHMGFQIGLSAVRAAGFLEAGNLVSWGFGVVVVVLVSGVVADLTSNWIAGWITGAIAAVGLYPAVWHVTSGPHALGDLAVITACLLALLPRSQLGDSDRSTLILICLASATAASTKLSLLPLALALTGIAVVRASKEVRWMRSAAIALAVWAVFYAPAVVWTMKQSGSPFGLATAAMFHSMFWDAETFEHMRAASAGLDSWRPFLEWIAASVSVGMVVAFGVLVWAGLKHERCFKVLLVLVAGQSILIALFLPPAFRFLGGLQYAVLVLAGWAFWPSWQGSRLIARSWIVLTVFCVPWLAVQMYYSIPFLKVVSGIATRNDFLDQFVAFSQDFRALDRILPAEAVLYVEGNRLPAYYAPRPVIFRLEDLRGRSPVYRFAVDHANRPSDRVLSCTAAVYENPNAVTVTYRTPGRGPVRQTLRVEPCRVGAAE